MDMTPKKYIVILSVVLLLAGSVFTVRRLIFTVPEKYRQFFDSVERKYSLPKDMLAKIAWQESRFRDDIISGRTRSRAGAVGMMQIVPSQHPGVNPLDVAQAVDYAGRYLSSLFKQFGRWDKAVAAYNWGPGNVARLGLAKAPAETRNYVKAVLT
jgi:soluble lytic murein transglycosylase-like protein